jgi:penicillin-binding protein 2A
LLAKNIIHHLIAIPRILKKRKVQKSILFASGIGICILIIGTAIWFSQLDITKLDNPLPMPSYILDHEGKKVSQLSSSRIDPVPLSQIPVHLRNAIIATEDRRFYEHYGVDVASILRALVRDLKAGDFVEGGSTITQQLAKNLFLPSDKSLSRKLKEAGYALKIDMTYNKDEILELYLNSIYFGEGQWGVQGAAKQYFAKNVQDLTLEESAMLAALPKAPTSYSPFKNKEQALERRNLVLSLMKEQHFITAEEYERAKAQPIRLKTSDGTGLKGKYAPYVDYVIEEAIELYGFTEEQLLTGGLQIYTEIDPIVQDAVQEVYKNDRFFPESKEDQLIQSGTVIIDQRTGGIRALIGYRGEGVFRGFNHASQLKRQPGSSFKPLVVYGPALEKGYTPASMLYDGELTINGYHPADWDHQTRGQVTLAEAVAKSWNIPAVWLLNEIGIDTGMEFAKRLGIPLTEEDRNLSIALGGLSTGVSPLQMAQAYSAFANQGTMLQAHAITKITTKDGHLLVEAKPASTKIMDPAKAYTMTLLLQNAVQNGTGKNAAMNRPVAGKSGTTQLPADSEFAGLDPNASKDAWFVGYTPELTAAVWIGYDKTDRHHYLTTSGGAVPATLFREMLTRALSQRPVVPFESPRLKDTSPKEDKLKKERENTYYEEHEPKGKGKSKKK